MNFFWQISMFYVRIQSPMENFVDFRIIIQNVYYFFQCKEIIPKMVFAILKHVEVT